MIVYCDGGSEGNGSADSHGYGSYKIGEREPERVEFGLGKTNNECEYETLIAVLETLRDRGIRGAQVVMDSKLVVEQVNGRWKLRAANLRPLLEDARNLMRQTGASLEWVPRDIIFGHLGH